MRKPFAHGQLPPHRDEQVEWNEQVFSAPAGRIISDEAEIVLRLILEWSESAISAEEIGYQAFLCPFQTLNICRQLAVLSILCEEPVQSGKFRLSEEPRIRVFLNEIGVRMGQDTPDRKAA